MVSGGDAVFFSILKIKENGNVHDKTIIHSIEKTGLLIF